MASQRIFAAVIVALGLTSNGTTGLVGIACAIVAVSVAAGWVVLALGAPLQGARLPSPP